MLVVLLVDVVVVRSVSLAVQWYFRTDESLVFIRVHFLPEALHDLKQVPNSLPSHVDPALDVVCEF